MGVHVLTIGSETFISDLRIRPIRHQFYAKPPINQAVDKNTFSSSSLDYNSNVYSVNREEDTKYTWNLEIRRLKKEDSALYYSISERNDLSFADRSLNAYYNHALKF